MPLPEELGTTSGKNMEPLPEELVTIYGGPHFGWNFVPYPEELGATSVGTCNPFWRSLAPFLMQPVKHEPKSGKFI